MEKSNKKTKTLHPQHPKDHQSLIHLSSDGDNFEYGRYVRDRKDGIFTQLQPSENNEQPEYPQEWDEFAGNGDHTSNSFRSRERQISVREKHNADHRP